MGKSVFQKHEGSATKKRYDVDKKSSVIPKTQILEARKYMKSVLKRHSISREYLQNTLDMAASTVEKRISGQTFTVKEMIAIANSLNMEFVYNFIPNGSEFNMLEYSEIAKFKDAQIMDMAKTIILLKKRISQLENPPVQEL